MAHIEPRKLISVSKTREIRFLVVTSTLTRGGTERAAMNYALGYRFAGYPSAVLAYGGGGPRELQLREAGVQVFLGGPDEASRNRAIEEARGWQPDILHVNRPGETDQISAKVLNALVHPRLRVIETNVFSRVDDSRDRVLIDLHMHLSRWCLWKWSQTASGIEPRSPGIVIPYSVDCDSFRPSSSADRALRRSAFAIPDNAVVFGRIGQPSDAKWSPILLRAFDSVARENGNVWLAVCGLPSSFNRLLNALPASVRSRVVELPMTSNDDELRGYYALMDVFAHMAQKGESFGLVLCEAMLAGLPVITLNTPLRDNSQIEVVPNGRTGMVVNNFAEAERAMRKCLEKGSEFKLMQEQGPAWVRQNYDISVVTGRLLAIAPAVLAASSSQELTSMLSKIPGVVSSAPSDLHHQLLKAAGVRLTLKQRLMVPLVNRWIVQRAIKSVRNATAEMRDLVRGTPLQGAH